MQNVKKLFRQNLNLSLDPASDDVGHHRGCRGHRSAAGERGASDVDRSHIFVSVDLTSFNDESVNQF